MRHYRRSFKCSDVFPAPVGDWFNVRDGQGKVVEMWTIEVGNDKANGHFRALITEYEPVDRS